MKNLQVDWSLIPSVFVCFFPLSSLSYYSRPREAHIEFGDEIASRLKLSQDGETILWPQPSDDTEDPQNVCPCLKAVSDYSIIDSCVAVVRREEDCSIDNHNTRCDGP